MPAILKNILYPTRPVKYFWWDKVSEQFVYYVSNSKYWVGINTEEKIFVHPSKPECTERICFKPVQQLGLLVNSKNELLVSEWSKYYLYINIIKICPQFCWRVSLSIEYSNYVTPDWWTTCACL